MTVKQLDRFIATSILKPNHLREDISGAPFKIGNKVKVLSNPNGDNTFDTRFINKKGEVIFFEYECGCGQTFPSDPMIGVKFANGKIEEFWKEELELSY